jgi:hypothetical protein
MTNKILSVMLVSAIVFASCQQSENKTTTTTTVDAPATATPASVDPETLTTLEWIDSAFDKGVITEGEKIEIAYRFKNTGEKPLIIKSVNVSCGCTVAEKPLEPIAPGKEGLIKAVFNSQNKMGPNHKTITVTANTQRETYPLTFEVTVNKKS